MAYILGFNDAVVAAANLYLTGGGGGSGAAIPGTVVVGDLLAADTTSSFARIAAPAVGQVLKSNGVGVAPSWSGTLNLSGNGALSAPAITGYGTWITGGTATTTKPYALIEPTGTTSTGWSTNGTGLGINAPSGFTGNLIDAQLNGVSKFNVDATGSVTFLNSVNFSSTNLLRAGGLYFRATIDTILTSPAAATLQHGNADAASPVAQTIKFQDVVAGTSNTAGVNATIQAPAGTGTGAGGSLVFQVAPAGSTGSAKNAWATALTIAPTGVATFGSSVFAGGSIVAGTSIYPTTGNRGFITAPSDGAFTFNNNAGSSSFTITAGASNLATFNGGVTVSGVTTSTGKAVIQSGSGLEFTANTGFRLIPTGDGVAAIQNIGGTDFSRLQFGGTTSSFPAWKRSTTSLQARLADDSAFTAIQGKLTTDTAYTAGDPTTTGYLVVYDSTGTAYEIPAKLH